MNIILIENRFDIIILGIPLCIIDTVVIYGWMIINQIGVFSASGITGPLTFVAFMFTLIYFYHVGKFIGFSYKQYKNSQNRNQFP